MLQGLVDFDGYYLESDPCLVCNNPEVPYTVSCYLSTSFTFDIKITPCIGLYYPSGENKGADQLHSYCEADLRLCFRTGKKPVFLYSVHFKKRARLAPIYQLHLIVYLIMPLFSTFMYG